MKDLVERVNNRFELEKVKRKVNCNYLVRRAEKKWMKKNKQSQKTCATLSSGLTFAKWESQKERSEKENLKKKMVKNFPNLMKKNLYIQETQWTPRGIKSNIYIWIHHNQIVKSKVKEILNTARKRRLIMWKESSIKLSSDFSLEITVTNRQWITCSKYWKKKTFNQIFCI